MRIVQSLMEFNWSLIISLLVFIGIVVLVVVGIVLLVRKSRRNINNR